MSWTVFVGLLCPEKPANDGFVIIFTGISRQPIEKF
jgi:hypothetical protein